MWVSVYYEPGEPGFGFRSAELHVSGVSFGGCPKKKRVFQYYLNLTDQKVFVVASQSVLYAASWLEPVVIILTQMVLVGVQACQSVTPRLSPKL